MTPNQGNQTKDQVGARVPGNWKAALIQYAHMKNSEDPYTQYTTSDSVRDAISEFLENHYDELPEEAKDMLDKDMLANAGGTEEAEA